MRPFRDQPDVYKKEDIYELVDRLEAALLALASNQLGQEILSIYMEKAGRVIELAEDAVRDGTP